MDLKYRMIQTCIHALIYTHALSFLLPSLSDDGKLFQGSGVGDAFGPRCFEGDVMGCGIMFPRDYILDSGGECTIRLLPSETDNHETNNVIRL